MTCIHPRPFKMSAALPRVAVLTAALLSTTAWADGHTPQFFGSINMAAEYRQMEDEDVFPSHFDLQDAFSYLGVSGEEKINDELTGFYYYSIYINPVDGELGKARNTAWYGKNVRREHNVARAGVKAPWGELSAGRTWNNYYDRITYTTDRFKSAWTGFDTYAAFQVDRTISFTSANYGGFDFGFNLVNGGGENATADTRIIVGASYSMDGMIVSLAYDDNGEDPNVGGKEQSNHLMALAAEYSTGVLRLGVKYEIAGKGNGYATASNGNAEEASLYGVIVGYKMGKDEIQFHYAAGDYPGYLPVNTDNSDATKHGEGSQFGVGWNRQVSDNLLVFAEYHSSNDYCVYDLSTGTTDADGDGDADNNFGDAAGIDTGCSVLSTGIHLGF